LIECRIARDDKQVSCGYGFVTFRQKSAYERFLEQRSHLIDNRRVNAQPSLPRKSKGQKRKRTLSNTRNNTLSQYTDDDYRNLLDKCMALEQNKRQIEHEFECARKKIDELQQTLCELGQLRTENLYLKSKCDYLQQVYEREETAEIDVDTVYDDDDNDDNSNVNALEERCRRLEERLNKLESVF